MRTPESDRIAAENGAMPCVGCPNDYAPPGEDYCFQCYHAPFGAGWEREMEDRMMGGF